MRWLCGLLLPIAAIAQQAGPNLSIDTGASRHSISPDIYGLNEYGDADGNGNDATAIGKYPYTVRRWGGDNSVSYNWKLDSNNTAANYYFETFPLDTLADAPAGVSSFDTWVARSQANRIKAVATVPIIGWTTSTRTPKMCSYSVAKYGAQQQTDPYAPDCGNGLKPDGKTPVSNDPNDVYLPVDPTFAGDWIQHVISTYGTTRQGGVALWELDNEPTWWHAVHSDIHPAHDTFDEQLDLGTRWAAAIKAADATAQIGGPIPPGWESYFYSATDLFAGWSTGPDYKYWNDPVDRNAHGMDFIPWYLQQMSAYERQHGVRLLDYLDIHAYIGPDNLPQSYDPSRPDLDTLRLTSTRTFWDPNYMPPRDDMIGMNEKYGTGTPQLIPRLKKWVADNYPGTKIAITEYNWGALEDITGALAQADLLGIFGREGLDLATIWGNPATDQPGAFAWRMFLDYDGQGNGFGETSVQAASADPDKLSVFAAERSDSALTVLVLNKTTSDLKAALTLATFVSAGAAQVWSYSKAGLGGIVRKNDMPVAGSGFSATFPAYSMTLFVLPAGAQTFSVPKPSVAAVVSAASYSPAVSPGGMVAIFGSNLGPATPIYSPALTNPDIVAPSLGGVRVLFDGVPAAMIAVSQGQVSAVVPYVTAGKTTVNVQVEYQGYRSDSFPVAIVPAAPAIFTLNASGKGPGAILNYSNNQFLLNGSKSPAAAGSVVVVFATGEGVTNPPGVDGRIATTILPAPVQPVTAAIGGQPAKVLYAGAAPANMAGLMQVNLEVPDDAPPGDDAVTINVGGTASQQGVTVAIK